MKSKEYIKNLQELCKMIADVPGDIVEIGVFKGDDAEIMCNFLPKKFIGIDTFNGYVEEDLVGASKHAFANQKSKRWVVSVDYVRKRLKGLNVELHKGDSKEIVPKLIGYGNIKEVALLYVDCNLYQPSLKAMKDIWPLISPRGILAIDEHLVGGETRAIKEFSIANNLDLKYFAKVGPSYYVEKQ